MGLPPGSVGSHPGLKAVLSRRATQAAQFHAFKRDLSCLECCPPFHLHPGFICGIALGMGIQGTAPSAPQKLNSKHILVPLPPRDGFSGG